TFGFAIVRHKSSYISCTIRPPHKSGLPFHLKQKKRLLFASKPAK
ncbi:8905_t:CDS:1, partial [Racocetra persica]